MKKTLLVVAGHLSLVLGIIGAFVPVLPTTPFIILAAFLYSKSSPRLHRWLQQNKYFGEAIIDWETNKVIRPRAKKMATIAILLVFSSSLYFGKMHFGLKIMLIIIAIGVLSFIWSRKSEPSN